MKLIFFDEEERTCSIENEEHMREFILSGELKGKTLLYDYENDILDKASQFGEYSRLVNKIMKEKTGVIDTASGKQEVSYKKTMSAGEKYIINAKKAAARKKSSKGCLIGLITIIAFGFGLIKSIFNDDDSDNQVPIVYNASGSQSAIPPEHIFIYDSLRSAELSFLADYDSLNSVFGQDKLTNFLNNSIMEFKDSLKLYKKKSNEIKLLVNSLKIKETKRFMGFLTFINSVSAADSIRPELLPDIILKAQKGDSLITGFYDMKRSLLDELSRVYDFFLSIQGKFKFVDDGVVFENQIQLDKYNELISGIKDINTRIEEWMSNKEFFGIYYQ